MVGGRVLARREVHPDLAVADLHREGGHVVGPGVEGAAAGQVEAGVVPGAGQDAVMHGAALQGEAHVRATIVHDVEPAVAGDQQQEVAGGVDRQAAAGLDVGQPGHLHPGGGTGRIGGPGRHGFFPPSE
jgi:hypothetical protein